MPDQPITRVTTVVLPVADQERALAFYRDALGFEVRSDVDFGADGRWVEVAPVGAQTVVALSLPSDEHPDVVPGRTVPFSLATSDLDAALAELGGRGVRFEEPVRLPTPAPSMAFFRDPDGNRLLLVEEPD